MSQITNTQKAAALLLIDAAITAPELARKFNSTFDVKHDAFEFRIFLNELCLGGIVSKLSTTKAPDGDAIFVPIENRITKYQLGLLCMAIKGEDAHRRAFWAGH